MSVQIAQCRYRPMFAAFLPFLLLFPLADAYAACTDRPMPNVDWSGCVLRGVDLTGANLRGAKLIKANLEGAKLIRANLANADLTHAYLAKTNLTEADLRGANLTNVSGIGGGSGNAAVLVRANLQGANLTDVHLGNADLSGANLSGANVTRVKMDRTTFTHANLAGVRGRWDSVSGVFFEAKLTGANFQGLTLIGDFRRADLSGANLSGANIEAANLTEANLANANLERVGGGCRGSWDICSRFPRLRKAILTKANLTAANLEGADLAETTLREANLTKTNLMGADLSAADLQGAVTKETLFQGAKWVDGIKCETYWDCPRNVGMGARERIIMALRSGLPLRFGERGGPFTGDYSERGQFTVKSLDEATGHVEGVVEYDCLHSGDYCLQHATHSFVGQLSGIEFKLNETGIVLPSKERNPVTGRIGSTRNSELRSYIFNKFDGELLRGGHRGQESDNKRPADHYWNMGSWWLDLGPTAWAAIKPSSSKAVIQAPVSGYSREGIYVEVGLQFWKTGPIEVILVKQRTVIANHVLEKPNDHVDFGSKTIGATIHFRSLGSEPVLVKVNCRGCIKDPVDLADIDMSARSARSPEAGLRSERSMRKLPAGASAAAPTDFGVAIFPSQTTSADALFRQFRKAMVKAGYVIVNGDESAGSLVGTRVLKPVSKRKKARDYDETKYVWSVEILTKGDSTVEVTMGRGSSDKQTMGDIPALFGYVSDQLKLDKTRIILTIGDKQSPLALWK